MTDIFLRPVTDDGTVILRDPTLADVTVAGTMAQGVASTSGTLAERIALAGALAQVGSSLSGSLHQTDAVVPAPPVRVPGGYLKSPSRMAPRIKPKFPLVPLQQHVAMRGSFTQRRGILAGQLASNDDDLALSLLA